MPAETSRSRADREDMEELLLLPLLLLITVLAEEMDEEVVVVENEVASFEDESSLLISVMVAVDSEEGCRKRLRSKAAIAGG